MKMHQKITINPNRIDLDEAYMQMAEVWAKRSKANRLQVGALIVKDRQIISDGYNGMPAGSPDDVCEYMEPADPNRWTGGLTTKREVLHAESNALMKIAENGGVGAQGATLYTTWSPCFECSKLIRQAKVKRVVYREAYRDTSGIDFLRSSGVQVDQLEKNESNRITYN
jgi:dCMP deaminase